MKPFKALIIPVEDQPGQPPGIWGGGNQPFPTPPIVIPQPPGGGPPLVIWGPNDPRPGWGLPPEGPGKPPGTWGGAGEPMPTPPIVIPLPPIDVGDAHPEHPIVLPIVPPPGIWGGGNAPFPTPPIVIPPTQTPGEPPREPLIEWKVGWSEETGWIVVGTPTVPHPTPSRRK